jgi:hypothetical protein
MAEFDAELLELAERTPAGRLARAPAAWLLRHEEPEDTEDRQQRERGAWWHTEPDGMPVVTIRRPPLAGGVLTSAVDATIMRGVQPDSLTSSEVDATAVASGSTESEVERIAPQSFIRLLIHDADRRPINASGRHRHPTARQKRV